MKYRAFVVEDSDVHATLAELLLQEAGFEVTIWRSIRQAWQWFEHDQTPQPMLGLLDIKLPDPSFPRLEGTVLAAAISDAVAQARHTPVHLVAISSELNPQREWAALATGCSAVLSKPLTPLKAQWLAELMTQPVPALSAEISAVAFRQGQLDVLNLLELQQRPAPRLWDIDDVRNLLAVLTTGFHVGEQGRQAGMGLQDEFGGATAAHVALRSCLPLLESDQARLLGLLLHGVAQQTIAGRLGLGRRKLESLIEQLLQQLAILLSQR
ncbi:response regulator [Herpetosiphon geysericola]|uniref:Response regulatory domain-containing protein n=1 Tax=Herpetosiphon geysericola TaxID=70996 RepID=A0A0P6Y1D0_9CHLR|nr:response regulator [Herpetosiphon geysericola]KPL91364.1 hypothetical protein SE18_02800 [Herpetosiphon geysericola]